MLVENFFLTREPSQLETERFDCIWLHFSETRHPFLRPTIQWLDWKMKGQIAKVLSQRRSDLVFIPTMGRLSSPYVAVSMNNKSPTDKILERCEGMKFRSLFFAVCDGEREGDIERELKGLSTKDHPEKIWLCKEVEP